MWRVFRLAMMWLLAAAVPLQGLAAATMVACGPGHHAPSSALAAVDHDHHGAEAAGGAAQSHVGGSLHQHADQHESADGETGLAKVSTQKCSACASCCTGTAIPSKTVTLGSVDLTEFFALLAPCSVAAYVTEGLERPPRLFLA